MPKVELSTRLDGEGRSVFEIMPGSARNGTSTLDQSDVPPFGRFRRTHADEVIDHTDDDVETLL